MHGLNRRPIRQDQSPLGLPAMTWQQGSSNRRSHRRLTIQTEIGLHIRKQPGTGDPSSLSAVAYQGPTGSHCSPREKNHPKKRRSGLEPSVSTSADRWIGMALNNELVLANRVSLAPADRKPEVPHLLEGLGSEHAVFSLTWAGFQEIALLGLESHGGSHWQASVLCHTG